MSTDTDRRRLPERDVLDMSVAMCGIEAIRRPSPLYKVTFKLRLLNISRHPVRLLGRKWNLRDNSGDTRIIEAEQVFNIYPLLSSGGVFAYGGRQDFRLPPVSMEVRFFGTDHTNSPFITPPLVFPRCCFNLPRR